MIANNLPHFLFVFFAFLVQVLLILNFAARNWQPSIERKYGWAIYALGIAGIALGILYWITDQSWYIIAAPLVFSIWAAFGFYVDTFRKIEWRNPRRWSIFIPYVALFMVSQFAFWIPLWYVGMGYWIAYALMYALNTGLNIYSHRKM